MGIPMNHVDPWMAMAFTAVVRVPTSTLHMVWTGLIGYGLARHLFLPDQQKPNLFMVLLPSMIAHGLNDYALSAVKGAGEAHSNGLAFLFVILFLIVSVGSCVYLGRLTGCRGVCCCNESCCCAPNFWEAQFVIRQDRFLYRYKHLFN